MITIDNLSFSYPEKEILTEISFNVKSGEVIGILGANGAGKTTLFKLLNGRLKPKSGAISIDGKALPKYGAQELARKIAVVPQNPSTSFAFTVKELISMGRRPYKGLWTRTDSKDESFVDTVIEETGLSEFADRSVVELSGGERQLVFLARSFVQQPQLLLLDEATSNLDMNHTIDIFSMVKKRVKAQGLTVAAIIHDINLAALFCDRILYISDKKLLGPDAPELMVTPELLNSVYSINKESVTVEHNPISVRFNLHQM